MSAHRPRILAIDDTPTDLLMLGAALTKDFDLQTATSGPLGLALALKSPPDLILLDVMMPGMDGFETCRRFKEEPELKDVPVVFVTAVSELDSEVLGLVLGAADYITKPINVKIARHRIRNLLERESLRKEVEAQRDLLEARVAERDRAQTALEQANAALAARAEQAEVASAARSRFLSSISHELRTPLHTILGYVRLLLKDAKGEASRQLAIVERSSAQLLKLIDDLLEFNLEAKQAEELQPDAVALRDLFGQLEHTVHLLARQGGNRFALALADDLPTAVWVDEQRLLQVLQNLLVNACKFTRDGTITLSVVRADRPRRAVAGEDGEVYEAYEVYKGDGGCRLRFAIDDSGAGIVAADLDHIFEVFHRGASAHGQPGLGLGLAIARQWVRAMGGEIQVHSKPGQGSRFFFTLELPTASATPHLSFTACEAFRERLASTPCRVLVVDDIAENRLLLRDLCERWGFSVLEAADGDHALSACLTAVPPIAVAFIDQFMSGMDGWELLRRLRQIPALDTLATVLISASAGQKPTDFPPGIDFDLVLGKPFDEQALVCFLCQRLRLPGRTATFCPHLDASAETMARQPLPADELGHFRELLDLGRVVRIEEWVQGLAARNPAYTDLAQQIVPYCRAGNLAALEKLAAAVSP